MTTTNDPMRRGYRSTEFYVQLAALILGALLAAHVFGDGSTPQRLIGAALAFLASLGYGVQRTMLKRKEMAVHK